MTPLLSDEVFRRTYGSYLCSVKPGLLPMEGRPGTCCVCAGPLKDNYLICRQCERVRDVIALTGKPFPLDGLAFLTYAVEGADLDSAARLMDPRERKGRQAYTVLKGYKTGGESNPWWPVAVAWVAWFLQRWGPWAAWTDRRDNQEWLWATIPSVRSGRKNEHPLHLIVSAVLNTHIEVVLRTTEGAEGRGFNPNLFTCDPVPHNAPVLLIDDSWTSGGNVLSASVALKTAGASNVNAMILGRLLNPGSWSPTREFIDHDGLHLNFGDGLQPGFDPARSPWTKLVDSKLNPSW